MKVTTTAFAVANIVVAPGIGGKERIFFHEPTVVEMEDDAAAKFHIPQRIAHKLGVRKKKKR